jgi:hypothetical protein
MRDEFAMNREECPMSVPMNARAPRLPPRRRWSALLLLSVFFVLEAGAAPAAEPVVSAPDWKAIKQVIADQHAALIGGKSEKAFAYATPTLRAQFGDAETFMAMVQLGYAALLTARYTEFLEGAEIDGLVIQALRLIGADNSVSVALYTMEKQPDGTWRISGCRIGPSAVQAAQWRTPAPTPVAIRETASSNRLA